jgi:hypothetical protein
MRVFNLKLFSFVNCSILKYILEKDMSGSPTFEFINIDGFRLDIVEGIHNRKTVALCHNFINRHNAFQLTETSSGVRQSNQH